jgi:hypothetical protein
MPKKYSCQCHCGAVQFTIELPNNKIEPLRCNCSLCTKKNALMQPVPISALNITQGADNLTLYQWNKKIAKHYFCKTCGIYTHHQRRSDPSLYGVNIACINKIDLSEHTIFTQVDGASLN